MTPAELRELLELAAKAAGAKIEWRTLLGQVVLRADFGEGFEPWNPADDDGDTLRLAVALGMDITFENGLVNTLAINPVTFIACGASEMMGGDPCAATRLAVLRAAAEIGRAMP